MKISWYSGVPDKQGRVDNGWGYLGEVGVNGMLKIKFSQGSWLDVIDLGNGEFMIRKSDEPGHMQKYDSDGMPV